MTSDMDQMAGNGGLREDAGAATGDSSDSVSGADAGRATNDADFASGGTDTADEPRQDWRPNQGPPIVAERDMDERDIAQDAGGQAVPGHGDKLADVASRLDGLDADGGTEIAGPRDRTDIGNLEGGQHDAATGGSDLGASTGGGDTGAI